MNREIKVSSEAPVRNTNDFEEVISITDHSIWDKLLGSDNLESTATDMRKFNKLMAYYSLAEQKKDIERLAIVMIALQLINKKHSLRDLFENLHLNLDASAIADTTKAKELLGLVKSHELRDYLAEKIGAVIKVAAESGIAQAGSVDVKEQSLTSTQGVPASSPVGLSAEVSRQLQEYKNIMNNFNSPKTKPVAPAAGRMRVDFSKYHSQAKEEKIKLLAKEILIRVGLTENARGKIFKNDLALKGLNSIAGRALAQIASVDLDRNNMDIIIRSVDIQVHLLLGQMVICLNNATIFGLIKRPIKSMPLIRDKDFEAIDEANKLFNKTIEAEKSLDSFCEDIQTALGVFAVSQVDSAPISNEQMTNYETGLATLVTKRTNLPESFADKNILARLGIEVVLGEE